MKHKLLGTLIALSTLAGSFSAHAVPLFARQTGWQCNACHTGGNYPELTSAGRVFKLTGYTIGTRQTIPLSGMLLGGYSKLRNHNGSTDPATDFAHDGATQLQQASVFTGGKIADNFGAFVQWTYDGVEHHSQSDNIDLRYARQAQWGGKNWIFGATLNNSPTTQDVFNSSSAWGFPYNSPGGAYQDLGTQPLLAGGLSQQVAGLGAYVDYDNMLYAELSGYRTADGVFSVLRKGQRYYSLKDGSDNRYQLNGVAPYWRLALHGDNGPHSWMVGALGMIANQYSDPADKNSETNRYKDYGVDAQYQWSMDRHRASVQTSYMHENTRWSSAAVAAGDYSNSSDTLNTWRIKGSYFFNNLVGGSVGWFSTTGSGDALHYADNTTAKPDTKAYVMELDYLPMEKVKVGLQYTGYTKFNGASSNYDTNLTGRKASDNNTINAFAWLMF